VQPQTENLQPRDLAGFKVESAILRSLASQRPAGGILHPSIPTVVVNRETKTHARRWSVLRHVVDGVFCLDLVVVVDPVEPGNGQRHLAFPCARAELRFVPRTEVHVVGQHEQRIVNVADATNLRVPAYAQESRRPA
jgi:hypothetical protein